VIIAMSTSAAASAAQRSPQNAAPAASSSISNGANKKNPTKKPVVTPAVHATADASLHKRMTVDKNIVDELLLVCGVIGTTTTTDDTIGNSISEQQLVPVTDCLNWLQDLQRCLRRDDDLYRPISLLLGQWKVVQQKLLPLIQHSRYDTAMVLTVCKILVILTKPLAANTVNAGRMAIDTKSGKTSDRYEYCFL
jgi:Timeless protein